MKNLTLIASSIVFLSTISCKKEEKTIVTDQNRDTLAVVTTETSTLTDAEAKAKIDKAQSDLNSATQRGDKQAEIAAQKALDDANLAWQNTKASINRTSQNIKNDMDSARLRAKQSTENAKKDLKDSYNETLEKMKAK